jgi:hypothetical protein
MLGAASYGANRIVVNSTLIRSAKLNDIIKISDKVVLMKHKLTSPIKITQYYERRTNRHGFIALALFVTYSHPFFPNIDTWSTCHIKTIVDGQFPLEANKLTVAKYSMKFPIEYDDLKALNIDYKLNAKNDYLMREFMFDKNAELYLLGDTNGSNVIWRLISINPHRLLYTIWDYGVCAAIIIVIVSSIYQIII